MNRRAPNTSIISRGDCNLKIQPVWSNMPDIEKKSPQQLIDAQANAVLAYLKDAGLPFDNIIATPAERQIINANLPGVIDSIPAELKKDARYLSKFVVGAGFGLFDYSLNSIWNEVVLDLRKKADAYGLDIFFDAAVGGGKNRDMFSTIEDLVTLKDVTLVDTCQKLELIGDVTHSKLRHILDMRNNIGISHPTNQVINAFELLGWLHVCLQDVLADKPTAAALQVQAFIANLKRYNTLLEGDTLTTVKGSIKQLPSHLSGNILRTVFGIFVSPDIDPAVRKNISLLAPTIWATCLDEPKYKLGIILEGYKANLHAEKYKLGTQFFEVVDGNAYRSDSERSLLVNELLLTLYEKHNGWDNFHHEAPVAKALASYIPDASAISKNFAEQLFKVILICRIGRGVTYNEGVSPRGRPYYDAILSFCGDKHASLVFWLFKQPEIVMLLTNSTSRAQAKLALALCKTNVISQRIAECFDYLIENVEANPRVASSREFEKLSGALV